ncbi:unnamed protein product [Porites evermanni]|uniref:UspA domain-containing protein n=1 Tax=Porites evermanni TaxID=104178 RepID=A0ABN8SBU0_9CNID|nr:unnamed protein product [Porites evermanni]
MSTGQSRRTVAIAVDSSDYSEQAFNWYKEHVYHDGDQLVLIHSHELQSPVLLETIATEGWKREVEKHDQFIKDLEKKYRRKCKPLKIEAKIIVQPGPPGQVICRVAMEQDATLIVMGCRGEGTVRRTILGSVSDYVIHHTHIPVLVVPREQDKLP